MISNTRLLVLLSAASAAAAAALTAGFDLDATLSGLEGDVQRLVLEEHPLTDAEFNKFKQTIDAVKEVNRKKLWGPTCGQDKHKYAEKLCNRATSSGRFKAKLNNDKGQISAIFGKCKTIIEAYVNQKTPDGAYSLIYGEKNTDLETPDLETQFYAYLMTYHYKPAISGKRVSLSAPTSGDSAINWAGYLMAGYLVNDRLICYVPIFSDIYLAEKIKKEQEKAEAKAEQDLQKLKTELESYKTKLKSAKVHLSGHTEKEIDQGDKKIVPYDLVIKSLDEVTKIIQSKTPSTKDDMETAKGKAEAALNAYKQVIKTIRENTAVKELHAEMKTKAEKKSALHKRKEYMEKLRENNFYPQRHQL